MENEGIRLQPRGITVVCDVTHRVATVENPRLHRREGIRERYNSVRGNWANLQSGCHTRKQDRVQTCEHLCLGESSLELGKYTVDFHTAFDIGPFKVRDPI